MSIKTTITNNTLESASIGDKTFTRRTAGGQVIYDGAGAGAGAVASNATSSESGLMSSEDKAKLDGIPSGGGGLPFIDDGWNGPKTTNLISITAKTVSNNNGHPNQVRLTINTDQGPVALGGLQLFGYLPGTKQGYMIPGNQP